MPRFFSVALVLTLLTLPAQAVPKEPGNDAEAQKYRLDIALSYIDEVNSKCYVEEGQYLVFTLTDECRLAIESLRSLRFEIFPD